MSWYAYILYLISGAAVSNSIPHIVSGITGKEFQTPFANPSPALLNGVWGLINLAIGVGLLVLLGGISLKLDRRLVIFAVGFTVMTLMLTQAFK